MVRMSTVQGQNSPGNVLESKARFDFIYSVSRKISDNHFSSSQMSGIFVLVRGLSLEVHKILVAVTKEVACRNVRNNCRRKPHSGESPTCQTFCNFTKRYHLNFRFFTDVSRLRPNIFSDLEPLTRTTKLNSAALTRPLKMHPIDGISEETRPDEALKRKEHRSHFEVRKYINNITKKTFIFTIVSNTRGFKG